MLLAPVSFSWPRVGLTVWVLPSARSYLMIDQPSQLHCSNEIGCRVGAYHEITDGAFASRLWQSYCFARGVTGHGEMGCTGRVRGQVRVPEPRPGVDAAAAVPPGAPTPDHSQDARQGEGHPIPL